MLSKLERTLLQERQIDCCCNDRRRPYPLVYDPRPIDWERRQGAGLRCTTMYDVDDDDDDDDDGRAHKRKRAHGRWGDDDDR